MSTYWIILILILTQISTPNVHICKFKYQIMFDHYAGHHLFDHCTDHHLSDHLCKYYTAFLICDSNINWISKETLMHNSDTHM